jgi:hypothetical protein
MAQYEGPLGRQVPPDWEHVEKYPLLGVRVIGAVERVLLSRPTYWARYDQGQEGACVGFGSSRAMSTLNREFYDAFWLYHEAQKSDGEPLPHEGTYVRCAMDVLRLEGHVCVKSGKDQPLDPLDGILANRWATQIDDVRTCVATGTPVVTGINWYTAFDSPKPYSGDNWVARTGPLGTIRGGHCVCIVGASDARQAVGFVNSWGKNYPFLTWMPYTVLERLIGEQGEVTVITDRPER